MSIPIRHLPVLQRWDCQNCGNCCREYHISVTADERKQIESQGWATDPAIGGLPLFVRGGMPWSRSYRLNHRPDGACVFLSDQNRCLLHDRFGPAAKPFPCRLYPFVLVPAGDHWRAGLRFACPAAAENHGKPLSEFQTELSRSAEEMEKHLALDARQIPAPPLRRGQRVYWPDLLRFVRALHSLIANRRDAFERRMRKCLALSSVCRQARFDQITGGRLSEFLDIVAASLDDDVPKRPRDVPQPSWVGRILFRQALAVLPRKDQGPYRGLVRGRLSLLAAAARFAGGIGSVPRLHAWVPSMCFDDAEVPLGPLPPEVDECLERYYLTKLGSLQFCGRAYFGFPLWEGFDALALTLPVILWLIRAMRDIPPADAARRALQMVDRNYGFNRVLGMKRQRWSLAMMRRRDELSRLVAWYSQW